jgi:hypothetical protein
LTELGLHIVFLALIIGVTARDNRIPGDRFTNWLTYAGTLLPLHAFIWIGGCWLSGSVATGLFQFEPTGVSIAAEARAPWRLWPLFFLARAPKAGIPQTGQLSASRIPADLRLAEIRFYRTHHA